MSKNTNQASMGNGGPLEKSYFEEQRALMVRDISESLEQVLQNLNKLNRSLEGVTAVGSEFSAVEALWSHLESVMAKEPETGDEEKTTVVENTQGTPSHAPSKR